MTYYELSVRFRTDDEPRKEMTAEQIEKQVASFLFPKGKNVTVLGSSLLRVDHAEERGRS